MLRFVAKYSQTIYRVSVIVLLCVLIWRTEKAIDSADDAYSAAAEAKDNAADAAQNADHANRNAEEALSVLQSISR